MLPVQLTGFQIFIINILLNINVIFYVEIFSFERINFQFARMHPFLMDDSNNNKKLALLKLKSQILQLETKLKSENIKYRQTRLREEINRLRKEYMEKDVFDMPGVKHIEPIHIDLRDEDKENILHNIRSSIIEATPSNIEDINFKRFYKKIVLRDISNFENMNFFADHIEILNCNGLRITIRAETIIMRNVSNSYFILEGAQLRMQHAKNLYCLFKSPIATAMEQSTNIDFQGHMGLKINDCINDFDNPFGSPNFKII